MRAFLFCTCLLAAMSSLAQDLIVKTDSSRITAKVLEISPAEIRYKLSDYPDGPTIVISMDDVAYLTFANGKTERYEKHRVPASPFDTYNLDQSPLEYMLQTRQEKIKRCEKLYTYKNYIGFNMLSLFNNSIGINYMRDIKSAHMVLQAPLAFGYGSPNITQEFYNGLFGGGLPGTTTYKHMPWQAGLGVLFAPSMNREVNFLIGPSYSCTTFDVHAEFNYATNYSPYAQGTFKNDFRLYRSRYGFTLGLMARFHERLSMHFLFTAGVKYDSYSQGDPYGYKYWKSSGYVEPQNFMPSVALNWGLGYRF